MEKVKFETIKDDALEVWLFPARAETLNDALFAIKNRIMKLSSGYIWHKEAFDVDIPIDQDACASTNLPPHLYGLTFFGDNIEDEWFTVYILIEMTKQVPGLVVRITDSDGEFLLIEAADALPKWANPETCERRVYLYDGVVHLIPPKLLNPQTDLTVTEAVDFIRENTEKTKASFEIQQTVLERISQYPEGINESFHHTIVNIPIKYAAVLSMQPQIISHVVNTYCNHDSIERKACKNIKLNDSVDTTVKFTKCLYAMMSHAKLIFESSWKLPLKNTTEYRRKSLGIKLSCGFEILLQQASNNPFESRNWRLFLQSLQSKGYFKGNLEGSKDYVVLLDKAKKYYTENECRSNQSLIGQKIKDLINAGEFESFLNKIKNDQELKEDSDEWLNVDPEKLNNLLNKRYGTDSKFTNADEITAEGVTDKLSKFLNQKSGLEGIDVSNDENSEQEDNQIDFDADQFADALKRMLDVAIPADDWNMDSGSDLSDYNSDEEIKDFCGDAYTKQMKCELQQSNVLSENSNTYSNLKLSVKEEKGGFGPSSSLLSNIGLDKKYLAQLDSDDDEE